MSNDALARRIREALAIVIDPELGKNVVEMGLIYAIECDSDGEVAIAMTTTTRGCPAASFLTEAVRERAAQVEGVHDVDVTLTYDPPWTPDMMTD